MPEYHPQGDFGCQGQGDFGEGGQGACRSARGLLEAFQSLGLQDIQIIYPALREREINWEACLNSLKNNQYDRCFVFAAPENISPAQFRGLKTTFDDVDRVLLQIANSRESKTNVNEARAAIIVEDVEALLAEISSKRRAVGTGSPLRMCWLDETRALYKRIDIARELGCVLDSNLKVRLTAEKALIMEDEATAKVEVKKLELIQKAKVHEASQSVPKRACQGLVGYDNWLSWSTEIRERLESVMTDCSKASIIYESLKVAEDKEYLRGVNSNVEILNYLNSKYNRPSEVCEAQLAIIKRLPAARNDKDMISNILKFLSIHRDLVRYEAAAKVDTYFVNSVRHIILS